MSTGSMEISLETFEFLFDWVLASIYYYYYFKIRVQAYRTSDGRRQYLFPYFVLLFRYFKEGVPLDIPSYFLRLKVFVLIDIAWERLLLFNWVHFTLIAFFTLLNSRQISVFLWAFKVLKLLKRVLILLSWTITLLQL